MGARSLNSLVRRPPLFAIDPSGAAAGAQIYVNYEICDFCRVLQIRVGMAFANPFVAAGLVFARLITQISFKGK